MALAPTPIRDKVGDGHEREPMFLREELELRKPSHRPVIVDDRVPQLRFQITFRRQVDAGLQVFADLSGAVGKAFGKRFGDGEQQEPGRLHRSASQGHGAAPHATFSPRLDLDKNNTAGPPARAVKQDLARHCSSHKRTASGLEGGRNGRIG